MERFLTYANKYLRIGLIFLIFGFYLTCKTNKIDQITQSDSISSATNKEVSNPATPAMKTKNGETFEGEKFNVAKSEVASPIYTPLGFGVGDSGKENGKLNWWHNWSYSSSTLSSDTKYIPLFGGGPVPPDAAFPASDSVIGKIKCYCRIKYHECLRTYNECKTIHGQDADCVETHFASGRVCHLGCANVGYSHGACSDTELNRHTKWAVDIAATYKGRTWLIFNEPDDLHQDYMTPSGAAQVYNYLYPRMKKADPTASLYCCGTHPGIGGTDKTWMREFVKKLSYPLDGIHYHNYYNGSGGWMSTENIIKTMTDFYAFMTNPNRDPEAVISPLVNYGNYTAPIDFAELPFLVTEWSALKPINADARCTSLPNNNLKNVMRPIKEWYLGPGRKQYSHLGLAWFLSKASSDFPSGLHIVDANYNMQLSCLGQEYVTYPNLITAPTLGNATAEQECARIDVGLPGQNWGEKHRKNAVLYDAQTNKPIARLADIDSTKPAACHHSAYWNGNQQWPNSYFRYFISPDDLSSTLQCHPNFSSGQVKVRFEHKNGIAYSPFSSNLTLNISTNKASCHYLGFPTFFRTNRYEQSSSGSWQANATIQNIGTLPNKIHLVQFNEQGEPRQCVVRRILNPLAMNSLKSNRCENDLNFGSALAYAQQPLVGVGHLTEVKNNGIRAAASYVAFDTKKSENKVLLPLIKNQYHNRSTLIYVQNLESFSQSISVTYRVDGQSYIHNLGPIAAFASRTSKPALARNSGNNSSPASNKVLSADINGVGKLAAVGVEYAFSGGIQENLQALSAFRNKDAGTKSFCPLFRFEHSGPKLTTGLQAQNVDSSLAAVRMNYHTSLNTFGPYLKSIVAHNSVTFYPPSLNPVPTSNTFGTAVVAVDGVQKILSVINDASSVSPKSNASFNCFASGAKKLFFPRFVESLEGITTGISIQNVDTFPSKIKFKFVSEDGATITLESIYNLDPGKSIVIYRLSQFNPNTWKIIGSSVASSFAGKLGAVTVEAVANIVAVANEAVYERSLSLTDVDAAAYEGITP
ncbi:MAG: hypothetical protein KBD78_11165 [Oligoflexales bacterium]|nr:hypothetical protein [Oligoflexales bacterium]